MAGVWPELVDMVEVWLELVAVVEVWLEALSKDADCDEVLELILRLSIRP